MDVTIKEAPTDVCVVQGDCIVPWLMRRDAVLVGSDLWRLRHGAAAWARSLPSRAGAA